MPGEPSWFDVTDLVPIEIETGTLEQHESNIIDFGENFFLRATIQTNIVENEWQNMRNGGVQYRVRFFAMAMTPNINDQEIGYSAWANVPNINTFTVDSPQVSFSPPPPPGETAGGALYECGCWVEFRNANRTPYYGILGYNKECVIQIHVLEEWQ